MQILDVPEPPVVLGGLQDRILQRLVEQTLMNDDEHVIEVPKISCPGRPPRAVLAATQVAEQLVEVLVVSASFCVLVPQMVSVSVRVPAALCRPER